MILCPGITLDQSSRPPPRSRAMQRTQATSKARRRQRAPPNFGPFLLALLSTTSRLGSSRAFTFPVSGFNNGLTTAVSVSGIGQRHVRAILRVRCSRDDHSACCQGLGSGSRSSGGYAGREGRGFGRTRAGCRRYHLAARAGAQDDAGSSAKAEKVYRADDTLVRESDIAACMTYDECDTSPETLGKSFGDGGTSKGGAGGMGPGGSSGGDGRFDGYDRNRFHVHFGAGRLGLGLVVGAIAKSRTPFSIVQRPKSSWRGITSQGCGALIEITVNGQPVASDVAVISEECDVEEYLKVARAALAVVGDRPTLLQLVRRATSFSCSLGAAMQIAMIPLLSELEDRPLEERPVLYACENDHDAVRRVGDMVKSKVTTIPCMVDRICTGRKIGSYAVNVEAEPTFDGSLVLLEPPIDPSLVPFAGEHVFIPTTEKEASYFYKRKFSVVNGMHTVLGFMTLREKAPGAKELREHELLAYETSTPEIQQELWAWVVVRCLALLTEFGIDMLKAAHSVDTEEEVFEELLQYGRQTLKRFSSIVDSTSRVLGGGLANRLTTRLQPMVMFMRQNPVTGTGLPGERFLTYAGVDELFAQQAVSSLARDSMPFCTADFIKANRAKLEERKAKQAQKEAVRKSRTQPASTPSSAPATPPSPPVQRPASSPSSKESREQEPSVAQT